MSQESQAVVKSTVRFTPEARDLLYRELGQRIIDGHSDESINSLVNKAVLRMYAPLPQPAEVA